MWKEITKTVIQSNLCQKLRAPVKLIKKKLTASKNVYFFSQHVSSDWKTNCIKQYVYTFMVGPIIFHNLDEIIPGKHTLLKLTLEVIEKE